MKLLLAALVLIFIFPTYAQNESEIYFRQATEAYQQGDYAKAINDFEKVKQQGFESGELYYNLGNSYFRNGDLGKAIFYLRKAKEILPRDPDVRFNLEFMRSKTDEQIEAKFSFSHFLYDFFPLSTAEAWSFFFAMALLLIFMLSLNLFWRKEAVRWILRGSMFLFIIASCSLLFRTLFAEPFAVVTAAQGQVFSGPGKDDILLFTLHKGMETIVEEENGDWTRIRLSDGKRGWLKNSELIKDYTTDRKI